MGLEGGDEKLVQLFQTIDFLSFRNSRAFQVVCIFVIFACHRENYADVLLLFVFKGLTLCVMSVHGMLTTCVNGCQEVWVYISVLQFQGFACVIILFQLYSVLRCKWICFISFGLSVFSCRQLETVKFCVCFKYISICDYNLSLNIYCMLLKTIFVPRIYLLCK